jgi:hypothetical protein
MLRPLLVLALLIVLPMLVLIVPTAHIWMPAARVYNAAHVLSPEAAQASTFINTGEAYLTCQQLVRQRLSAQPPVTFPGISDVTMFKKDDYLTVIGQVDAQTRFGEPTRTPYTCNVRPTPGGQWQLVSLYLSK